jgi:hypothetical protein
MQLVSKLIVFYDDLGPLFLLFHLGDAYFFVNEMIKVQGTSAEEAELYGKYQK